MSLELIGYIISILIGVSLGLIGGGGSILTMPILVYLFKVEPVTATTYSLFIVGFTSLAGGVKAVVQKHIDFRAISLFGIPSILSIFIARHFILPAIPEKIFNIGQLVITKGVFFMLIFALLMLIASVFMIKTPEEREDLQIGHEKHLPIIGLVLPGFLVGLITGLLGAGGGFLIIPALVLIIKIPMKTAIGTSLIIIAINSTFGFIFSIGHFYLDWTLLLSFTALAVIGVFIGSKLGENIPAAALKKGFGWFVVLIGVAIIVKELFTGH